MAPQPAVELAQDEARELCLRTMAQVDTLLPVDYRYDAARLATMFLRPQVCSRVPGGGGQWGNVKGSAGISRQLAVQLWVWKWCLNVHGPK